MPDFPLIETIRVPTLSLFLIDERNSTRDVQFASADIMQAVLFEAVLGAVRPGTVACHFEHSEHVEEQRRDDIAADTSIPPQVAALDSDEYEASIGDRIVIDESDCDPRLPVLTFNVIVDDVASTNIGLWTLYNIRLEQSTPGRITANAMALPGVIEAPGHTFRETISGIMRFILAINLRVQDPAPGPGRIIDFVEWRYPQRVSHEWVNAIPVNGMTIDQVVNDVAAGNIDQRRPDGVPEFVRRTGAPPRP